MRIDKALFMACLLVLAGGLPGCAAIQQTSDQVAIRQPGERFLSAPTPAADEARRDLEFAWLSGAAYGNTPAGLKEKSDAAALAASYAAAGSSTAAPEPASAPTPISTPASASCPLPQASLFAAGWQPWPGFPTDGLLERIQKYHLRVEVWTRQAPPAVAVAFGGTVFNNQSDWASNLRWFLPKWFLAGHPDEYSETVQAFAPAFVEEFKNKLGTGEGEWAFLKDAKLYVTGHSLGGGLAQQFAYALPADDAVPRVAHVFAFDPSPVTGYYSVEAGTREHNQKTLFIDRVYERGEVLALVRSLTSVFVMPSPAEPTIRGVRFQLFYPANPIAGHSMSQLACRLGEATRGAAPP